MTTEQRTISEIGFQAMVDFAAQPGNEQSLANGGKGSLGEVVETRLVQALFERLELPEVLERIRYGNYPGMDLKILAWEVNEKGMKELHKLMEFVKATHTSWPSTQGFSDFSKFYWDSVIRDRIERGDFRRAWDDIRQAAKEQKPFNISRNTVEQHLLALIRKMEWKKAIEWKSMEDIRHFHRQTSVHGLSLILRLYPECTWRNHVIWSGDHPRRIRKGSYKFTHMQRVIMQLAEHFAKQRSEKRSKAAAR